MFNLRSILPVFLLASGASAAGKTCGSSGMAFFNDGGQMKQGYEGELYMAVRCVLLGGDYCLSDALPPAAQGSVTTVQKYYGSNLSNWCTGLVTSFEATFYNLPDFNEPLFWDTGSAKSLYAMFFNASSFDQDITNFDVADVTNFGLCFFNAAVFNQEIGKWNVAAGTNFAGMFNNAKSFNGNLANWKLQLQAGSTFDFMFYNAKSFNQDFTSLQTQFSSLSLNSATDDDATLTASDLLPPLNVFTGTNCANTYQGSDVTADLYCEPGYDVGSCLETAYTKAGCDCGNTKSCAKKLKKAPCKKQYLSTTGLEMSDYKDQIKIAITNQCK